MGVIFCGTYSKTEMQVECVTIPKTGMSETRASWQSARQDYLAGDAGWLWLVFGEVQRKKNHVNSLALTFHCCPCAAAPLLCGGLQCWVTTKPPSRTWDLWILERIVHFNLSKDMVFLKKAPSSWTECIQKKVACWRQEARGAWSVSSIAEQSNAPCALALSFCVISLYPTHIIVHRFPSSSRSVFPRNDS